MKIVDGEPGLLVKIFLMIRDFFFPPEEAKGEELEEYKKMMREKGYHFEGDKEK